MVVSELPTIDTTELLKNKSSEENLTLDFKKKEDTTQIKQENVEVNSSLNVGVIESADKFNPVEPELEKEALESNITKDTDNFSENLQNENTEEENTENESTEDESTEDENAVEIMENEEIIEEPIDKVELIEEDIPQMEITPKVHTFDIEKKIESGLQIQFTSLKLNNFPIVDSNLSSKSESIESTNFNNINILIGNEVIYNVDLKIHNYQKFRMLEMRTREFKIALSINLTQDNTIESDGNGYFKYVIFSKIKNNRLFHIAKIFQKIFSGDTISFTINNFKGIISVDNRIQYHKFILLEQSLSLYYDVIKKLHVSKIKNLSDTDLSFYTLYLLNKLLDGETKLDSWLNFSINNEKDVKVGDYINFTKIHKLNIKGIKFNLKETLQLKEPIKASELVGEKINCYKKAIKIKLEKVDRI